GEVADLVARLGPELEILQHVPLDDVAATGSTLLAEALGRLRRGEVLREAGYDGEYGVIRLFEPKELADLDSDAALFDLPAPPAPRRRGAVGPGAEAGSSRPDPSALPPGVSGRPAAAATRAEAGPSVVPSALLSGVSGRPGAVGTGVEAGPSVVPSALLSGVS